MVSGIPWASGMISILFVLNSSIICAQGVWTGVGENGVANHFCAPEALVGSLGRKKSHHEMFPQCMLGIY